MSTITRVFVVCDRCGKEFMGWESVLADPKKGKARAAAKAIGWTKISNYSGGHKNVDFCPACIDKGGA